MKNQILLSGTPLSSSTLQSRAITAENQTGSEDYVGSGWGLGQFHAQEMGAPLIKDQFISCYRFHLRDPVSFNEDIKVTVQQLGRDGVGGRADPDGSLAEFIAKGEYRKDHVGSGQFERIDDMCSTAYRYQTLPTQPFPPFPDKELRSAFLSDAAEKKTADEGAPSE